MLDVGDGVLEGGRVARPLLSHGQGSRVLEVRTPDLDDLVPLARVLLERLVQALHRGDRLLGRHRVGRDVHGRREGVVGRLAHVDVVVGVHRLLRAELASEQLDAPVGDDLVDVHVRLRTRAGLPHVEREVVVELTTDHLVADALDERALPRGQTTVTRVDHRRGLLDVAVGVVDLVWHAVVADVEVDEAPLRLRSPVAIRRDHHVAEAVELLALTARLDADGQVEDLRGLLSRRTHSDLLQYRSGVVEPQDQTDTFRC